MILNDTLAARFARIALGHVGREYPNKMDHVLDGPADAEGPRALHPVFYGSYDWHSCVHSWWLLLTIRRLFPGLPESRETAARADALLTDTNVAGELAYLARPSSAGFERPYGWAWLLALHGEAARHADKNWGAALAPLAGAFAGRFKSYFPKQLYPIRSGAHANTAFAFILALDWVETHDAAMAALIRERAETYFGTDRDCPAWEPGGDEFLSPAMVEALCMKRVLSAGAFERWLGAFLPRLGAGEPATLFRPAAVLDRSDGKLVHLDGFNFTRAWVWRELGDADAAARHLAASLP
ncbi:MAG: DUF2891 domain-containing protein, partial [Sphingomonadaceae bacterium]|nr:DUF2891 domain-containing protein [Sphingomonadaceae bacterium]